MKVIVKLSGIVFVLVFLIGCTTIQDAFHRSSVEIEDDEFESYVTFNGVVQSISDIGLNNPSYHFLRSFVDKETGQRMHQVYVRLTYGADWRFYRGAQAVGGESLEFIEIDSDVDCYSYGCSYKESFGVTVDEDALIAAVNDGFTFKAVSKSGIDTIIEVTPEQISAQRTAIETWIENRP